MADNSIPDSLWGATLTTTIQTRLTALPNQPSITVAYPWPSHTVIASYTTLTRTQNVLPKQPPDQPLSQIAQLETVVLPVLILTNVEAMIVNTRGEVMNYATLVQPAPSKIGGACEASGTALVVSNGEEPTCVGHGYMCWSQAQKIGTIVAVAVVSTCIIFLLYLILGKCRLRKSKNAQPADSPSDIEHGNTPVPLEPFDPFAPVALMPDNGKVRKGDRRRGAIWLWRKKHMLEPVRGRSRSRSISPNMYSNHPVLTHLYAQSNNPTITPITLPSATYKPNAPVPPPRKPSGISGTSQYAPSVRVRDFAYSVGDDGDIRILKRPPPPIATVDADSGEKERSRQARRYRKAEANVAMAEATAAVLHKRAKEQEAYDHGHENRKRRERSRSEVSERYEKRGDRLRKESPEAKRRVKEERTSEDGNRRKLKAQRSADDGFRRSYNDEGDVFTDPKNECGHEQESRGRRRSYSNNTQNENDKRSRKSSHRRNHGVDLTRDEHVEKAYRRRDDSARSRERYLRGSGRREIRRSRRYVDLIK